jgi:hypothetical protein
MLHRSIALAALAALLVALGAPQAADVKTADLTTGLTAGAVELKSAGPLAFGPEGVLFVGDPRAATIYAIDTGERTGVGKGQPNVEGIDGKIAAMLGTEAREIQISDLAVNPATGTVYLSVGRGRGPSAAAALMRVTRDGKLSELSLKNVKSAKATIPNPATKVRQPQDVLTDIGYVNGRVYVAGLSTEDWASTLRSIPFPFDKTDKGTSIQIYHGAHGKWETQAPVRVFAPYKIAGEDHLLAAYTCTPLVKLPVSKLTPGEKLVGTTIAELGNRNQPLSMIVYQKGGKDYVLMSNTARGLMKISLAGADKIEGIKSRIADKAGLTYETIKDLSGVQKLDALGKEHAVILIRDKTGKTDLKTIDLP